MKPKLRGRPPGPRDYKDRTPNQARFLKAYARVGMIGVAGRDGENLSPEPCEVDARRAWIPQAVPAGANSSLVHALNEGVPAGCSNDGSNESKRPA